MKGEIVYNGLRVMVGGLNSIEDFEGENWYMQAVDDETVREAVKMVKKYIIV